ncbi:hypothetical protein H0H87_000588 [Tephrocybe sp. NHM501043]|nr:hypothetical protein H0H87_000588 [Tephrocybe sp. NHM501043]
MDPRNENVRERDQAATSITPQSASTQSILRPNPISTAPTQIPAQSSPTSTLHPQASISPSVRPIRSADRLAEEDTYSPSRELGRYGNPLPPLPPLPSGSSNGGGELRLPARTRTVDTHHSGRPASRLDWIVPVEEKVIPKMSVGERLLPTLTRAQLERDKYAVKAKMTGYALNAAIGMQVLLGSLTTGLAAATLAGKQAAIATTILGMQALELLRVE